MLHTVIDLIHQLYLDGSFRSNVAAVITINHVMCCRQTSPLAAPVPVYNLCCQRVAPSPVVVNPGSDNGKEDGRSGPVSRTVSPFSASLHDETLDADDQEAFLPPENADAVDNSENGKNLQRNARSATWGRERVVRIPNETARWVFSNQTNPDDTDSAPVRESFLPRMSIGDALRPNHYPNLIQCECIVEIHQSLPAQAVGHSEHYLEEVG